MGATNYVLGGSENHAKSTPPFLQTKLEHRAGYLQNHCSAGLLDDVQPSIGVVCGSVYHMFELLHNIHRTAYRASAAIDRVGFGHGGAHIDAVSCLLESHGCPGPFQLVHATT
jgi:hypothetical protein